MNKQLSGHPPRPCGDAEIYPAMLSKETSRVCILEFGMANVGAEVGQFRGTHVAADMLEVVAEQLASWGGLTPGTKVQKVALYPRVDPVE